MSLLKTLLLFIILSLNFACAEKTNLTSTNLSVTKLASPAAAGSAEPNLHIGANNRLYLSWLEPKEEAEHALKYAILKNSNWTQPREISFGKSWFVNWADFPSLAVAKNGQMAAQWLQKNGKNAHGYQIKIARSQDGVAWQPPVTPHRDASETEHGFVSMLHWSADQLFCVWLDGRNYAKTAQLTGNEDSTEKATSLRFTLISATGQLTNEQILDDRVCDCCPTDAAKTSNGALVVYRNRTDDEIRDFNIISYRNGVWSQPAQLSYDNWKIAGCPVNGAAIDAKGNRVVVAWFTMANDTPTVKVAFSNNEGDSFSAALRVDDGEPIGRVDVALLADNSAVVSWLETAGNGAELRIRRITADKIAQNSLSVTKASKERAGGFPKMAYLNNRLFFAWTEPGQGATTEIRTAFLKSTDFN